MSTVIAVKKGNSTVIGCDSKFSEENLLIPSGEKKNWGKIHTLGNALVGHVGDSAYHTVLDYLSEKHQDLFYFDNRMAVYESMLQMQQILLDKNMLKPQGEEFLGSGLYLLIATPDAIYQVDRERGVDEFERFWAIGSGSAPALAAMDVLYQRLDSPEEIAGEALRVACKYDLHSQGDCRVLRVE